MTATLPVSEVFGPTLQGEGPHAGRAVVFIRLGGCNLACSWCDSPYTWDASRFDLRTECPPQTVPEIITRLNALAGGPLPVVISGGEPLIHQKNPAFGQLLNALAGREVHVETNGTIAPTRATLDRVAHFTVSPKLPNAGVHKRTQDPTPWAGWPNIGNAIVKYVVTDAADVHAAIDRAFHLGMPADRIWVMPEGTNTTALAARWPIIARTAADAGINATHRLHVLAWGDTKGT